MHLHVQCLLRTYFSRVHLHVKCLLRTYFTQAPQSVYIWRYLDVPCHTHHARVACLTQVKAGVRLHVLGQTLDGHDLDCLQIGEPGPGKRTVWITARQHPGEGGKCTVHAGAWINYVYIRFDIFTVKESVGARNGLIAAWQHRVSEVSR